MKNKKIKKILAAMTAAAMITMTAVPALANETAVKTSGFGVTYTVDYTQGAANIAGKRVYFGLTAKDPYVAHCGWRRAVELKAAEMANMSVLDPAWFDWATEGCPSLEDWARWNQAK